MPLLERENRRELYIKSSGKRVWRIVSPNGRILDEFPVKAKTGRSITRRSVRQRAMARRRRLHR